MGMGAGTVADVIGCASKKFQFSRSKEKVFGGRKFSLFHIEHDREIRRPVNESRSSWITHWRYTFCGFPGSKRTSFADPDVMKCG